jgi:hypothetical protein
MEQPMTDLLTLVGMMATITGIFVCLFFLFTPVTFGATEPSDLIDRSTDLQISMRWIQPILGQAIVEDAMMRQRSNAAGNAASFVEGSSKPSRGSVQWMLGRVIVELNRSRLISVPLAGNHETDDQRIVTIARHTAEQFL